MKPRPVQRLDNRRRARPALRSGDRDDFLLDLDSRHTLHCSAGRHDDLLATEAAHVEAGETKGAHERIRRAPESGAASLARDAAGEAIDFDHAAAVKAAGDGLLAIVRFDLKGDDRAINVDHSRLASDGESLRHRREVLHFNISADAPFPLVEQRSNRVTRGIFEMGYEPGSG
jgi:hypothetical protein